MASALSPNIMANSLLKQTESLVEQPPIHFLEGKDEAFMVALPWVGAAITLALWFLGRFGVAWTVGDVPLMLFGLIFIDGVHVIFTFVLLLSLPEVWKWSISPETRSTRGWAKGRGFWTRTVVIAAALGFTFWLLKVSPKTSTLRGMATTWLLLELVGPAQHTIAQMRGISFCYNGSIRRKIQFNDAEKKQAARCEKIERRLFSMLLWGEIFYWIPDIFGIDKLIVPQIDQVHFVGGVMSVAAAAALVVNGLYFPRQEESRKSLFLFRVLLFPLKMLTTVGGIALRAAHGTEYLIIFRRMVQGSNIPKPKKTKVFLLTIAISSVYAILFVMTWPIALRELTGFSESNLLLGWAMLGAFIIRFTHYYMDSMLYRMSDPATRNAIAPLLTTPPPSSMERGSGGDIGYGLRRGGAANEKSRKKESALVQ